MAAIEPPLHTKLLIKDPNGELRISDPWWEWFVNTSTESVFAVGHAGSAGTSHSEVVSNSTHRTSDGKDHSDVVLNNTHRTSNGSDHGFIDQSVTTAASPSFAGLTVDSRDVLRYLYTVAAGMH